MPVEQIRRIAVRMHQADDLAASSQVLVDLGVAARLFEQRTVDLGDAEIGDRSALGADLEPAVDLVDMVGLMDRVDDLPTTFSRGLKQKAALTMAFVRPFDVMLIDEPFVGLDRLGKLALLDLLKLAHGDGATLVVATHELSSVNESSRLIALSNGELVYDGDPATADLAALTEGARHDRDDQE